MQHSNLTKRQVIAVFLALMTAMFVGSLDQTIVSTALPTIAGELGGVDHMLWVSTAYMLASTIMMPLYGKFGDLFGRKYLFCGALVFFVAGSCVCGLVDSMSGLIAGRAVQGLGGGGLMILSQAIIADIFPPAERGKYMGVMGASFGVSMIIGPLLGGFFTETLSWRWCFWVNVPLGLAALALCAWFFASPSERQAKSCSHRHTRHHHHGRCHHVPHLGHLMGRQHIRLGFACHLGAYRQLHRVRIAVRCSRTPR